MPYEIDFDCDVKIMQRNSWEEDEYPGDDWIKFSGENGTLSMKSKLTGKATDKATGSNVQDGSSITGYYNVETHEIAFVADYNMMSVKSECPQQEVDKSRFAKFDEEIAQYEKDLQAYNDASGL